MFGSVLRTAHAAPLVTHVVSFRLLPVVLAVIGLGCGAEPDGAVEMESPRPAERVLAGDGDDGEHVVWDPVTRAEIRRVRGRFVGPGHGDVLVTYTDRLGDPAARPVQAEDGDFYHMATRYR
jgi:hypothetical protein